ncbi:MAG: putative ABC transporter permease, partial [Lachnospiraceae bacterium]|nr:putative ABC transporter permease [Lachnospiraceae bacterium]
MKYTFYEIMILFFLYSFLGWAAETTVVTIKEKNFRNRGFVSGPFCFIYGLAGVVLTIFLQELRNNPVYLFLGSTIIATTIEWFVGKTLERMKQKKWWDYSQKRWNFDGYICLQYSVLWGLLGFGAVRYTNDWLLILYGWLPDIARMLTVWILVTVGAVDILGSMAGVFHLEQKLPRLFKWNLKLQKWTEKLADTLVTHVEERIKH